MASYNMIFKLIGYMKHLAVYIGIAVAFAVSGHVLVMVIPALLMRLGLANLAGDGLAWWWLPLLLGLSVGRGLLRYGEHYFGHYVAFRVLADFRAAVFAKLRRLAPTKLTDKTSGDLLKMMGEDIEALEVFFAHTLAPVMTGVVLTLLLVIYYSQIHWGLVLIAVLTYGLLPLLLPRLFAKRLAPILKTQGSARLAYSRHFVDSLKGMRDLVQFHQAEAYFQTLQGQSEGVNAKEQEVAQANYQQTTATFLVVGLSIVAVALLLIQAYGSHGISLETAATAFIVYTSSFAAYLELSRLPLGFKRAILAGERVFALLEESERDQQATGRIDALERIDLDQVSFAYEARDASVLEAITQTFPKGKIIGLLGPSGSGKTTLMKLVMNWYLPQQGEVRLNQEATGNLNPQALQERIAYIPQIPQLFNQTLRENLRLSNPSLTDDQILEVAAKCHIKDVILGTESGLDTVWDNGQPIFSSGEMQRMELTRALLKEADCYIFDEPTSYLDSLNEAEILRIIQTHCRGYVFLISHRKSTLAIADHIYQVNQQQLTQIK